MLDSDKRLARVVLLLAALLCFYRFWTRDLTYYDEPRYAGVAKEMSDASSWAIPLLYDAPYTEKPPLYFWTAGLLGRALGFNSFALFLPNVLAHFLTVLLVYDLGRRTLSRRAGAFAALAFAACPLLLHYARSAQLDSLLVLAQAAAAYGFVLALEGRGLRFGLFGALGLALGFLVKGHLVLPALIAPLVWCFLRRDWSCFRRPRALLLGAIVALAPFLVWFGFVVREIGWSEAVGLYFRRQILERTAGQVSHFSPVPVGPEYLAALAGMLPLVAFVPGALRRGARSLHERAYAWWGAVFFLVFALVPVKRELYLLPLAVPLALAAGAYLARLDSGELETTRAERLAGALLALLLSIGAAALPIFLLYEQACSADAVLAAAGGLALGVPACAAFLRRRAAAPLLLFLQLAVLLIFAEPAVAVRSNSRFGLREFGAAIQTAAPPGAEVIVLGFTKAHAVRFFGERRLRFAEEIGDLPPLLGDRETHHVVVRGNEDGPDLEHASGMEAALLATEPKAKQDKALRLYAVRAAK
ncbi:MAG: glycosyltransferase family 39 protein [Planctomycetes bacterium]|nr:glycosyltransferase family 39 protein [Planctomycetota bacterium]